MKIEIDISASESVEFIKLLSQSGSVSSADNLAKEITKNFQEIMNDEFVSHRTVYNS